MPLESGRPVNESPFRLMMSYSVEEKTRKNSMAMKSTGFTSPRTEGKVTPSVLVSRTISLGVFMY